MRRAVSILLLLLGVVGVVWGVGKLTFWAPPQTLTASAPEGTKEAPVTLITREASNGAVGNQDVGDVSMTIKAEGGVHAVMGRSDDVKAWVGPAATNALNGVDAENHVLKVQHTEGEATVPSPAGSDLWVQEERHDGTFTTSWKDPGAGDWTMMLASDGGTAAPLDITLTWDNPAATQAAKLGAALPLIVVGGLIFLVGLVLLAVRKRAPKRPTGRRSAGSGDAKAEPAATTGRQPVVAPGTGRTDETLLQPAIRDGAVRAPANDPTPGQWGAAGSVDAAQTERLPVAEPASSEAHDAQASSGSKDSDDDDLPGAGTAGGQGADDSGRRGAEGSAQEGRQARVVAPSQRRRRGLRTGAAAAATFGLLLPAAPGWADETPTPSGSTQQENGAPMEGPASPSDSPSGTPGDASTTPSASDATQAPESSEGAAGDQPGYPVVIDVQLQRILADVSKVAEAGDSAKDAAKLDARFGGDALKFRTDAYAVQKKGVKLGADALPTIADGDVKAAAITTTSTWPRTLMVVTQDGQGKQPQILTLEQQDARSNYKVIQATRMVPEAQLPGVALGSEGVATLAADASGLEATPQEVLGGLGAWMSNPNDAWAQRFEKNFFVDQWRTANDANKKAVESEKGKYQIAFSVDPASVRALSMPSKGALVTGFMTQTTTITPEKKDDNSGEITLDSMGKSLTGKDKTDKTVVLTTDMPVAFYVPPAGSGEKIRLVGNLFVPVSGQLK